MEDNIELRIKLIRTDLADRDYIYRQTLRNGNIFSSSIVYENSGYISKLQAINNYSGGSIAVKDDKDNSTETVYSEKEYGGNDYDYYALYGGEDYDDDFYCDEDEFDESEDYDGYDYDYNYEYDEGGEYDIVESNGIGSGLSANQMQIEFNTTGRLSVSKNIIKITYDELDSLGYGSTAEVNIYLDTKNRDIITIQKEDYMKSTLTLEKNKKSVSNFEDNLSASNIALAVNTLKMTNKVTRKGGAINLLYTVEANGSLMEMIAYSLSAERKKNG